ncbi:GNAT family N-acetyltransferase [Falsibacillus pallidus]|uniref:RimJ/RimL family protein N-acetyltransferase n=1 Tax=Falsibacillus pallidus TaxID=493781 RepID=A0A370GUS5_9BACI|nr:GNAT family N-acetyltransferase [Falsibacillus pallidus]RDI45683.1 RimJ/RimL family protein N-acetyltransferase [Falsibacillus pallidus]
MKVVETERLILRWLTEEDAGFMLQLLNDTGYIQFIGDRGVRTEEEARNFLLNGPIKMYQEHGIGLYLVEMKEDGDLLGICGLIKRDGLEDIDIGFAFLEQFRGQGYAFEAAEAALAYGKDVKKLKRIVAITTKDNESSTKLLEKIGLRFESFVTLPNDTEELKLLSIEF